MVKHTAPRISSVSDQDGAVILDFERNSIVCLNSSGGFIWEKLRSGSSVREIALALAQETQEEIDVVERDVRDFLNQLKSNHLAGSRIGRSDAF